MKLLLITNPCRDRNGETAAKAAEILKQNGAETVIKNDLSEADGRPDAIVTFGGDGTLLNVACAAAERDIPLLGVNCGNVGFLAALEQQDIGRLAEVARGEYNVSKRMLLDIRVRRNGETVFDRRALNDCTVTRGARPKMISLEISCDGRCIRNMIGDGVVFSTPTGSTAYSLSAGGPIVDPQDESMVITPICAHAIYAPPFVMAPERVITVRINPLDEREVWLSVDGSDPFDLYEGDEVEITRSKIALKLMRVGEDAFFDILHRKLNHK